MIKKIFIVFQFVLLFAFSCNIYISNTGFSRDKLSIQTVSAAESSRFQNTQPWWKEYWGKLVQKAQSSISFFQNHIPGAVNGNQSNSQSQDSLSQFPALSGQNTQNNSPSQFPVQNQGGGDSQQQGGGENGTPGSPYKLEPNQFKKYCGQNAYVLYWRKGGEKGRDMAKPKGGGSGNEGARDYWQLPTCEELAKCHCCCNTCTFPQGIICPSGWCFSKSTICDDKKDCTDKCSNVCDAKCKKGCEDYKEPTHEKAFNRDCKCNQEGCPESAAKDCKIIIEDPGQTDVEYTKKEGNPEQYFKAVGKAYFTNGNGKSQPVSKIIAWPNDKADPGYVSKLKDEKGKCCKCYQDGPPIK